MKEPTTSAIARRSTITRMAAVAIAAAMPLLATSVRSHTDKPHAPKAGPMRKEQKDWGIASDARNARRSIEVGMADNMRFTPERIEVRQGETLKFVVRNTGKVVHEFVIGTRAENAKHAELMLKFPTMEHDEPYMAHVPPGKAGEIVWTFNRVGEFEFACLIAGHYQGAWSARSRSCLAARPSDHEYQDHPNLRRAGRGCALRCGLGLQPHR